MRSPAQHREPGQHDAATVREAVAHAGPGPRAGWSALRGPALVGLAGLGVASALHLRDPHVAGSWGLCPFHAVTGLWCPGCGGLRAISDLTHGDLAAAVSSNGLAVVLVAVLAVAFVAWVVRRWRGVHDRMIVLSPRWSTATLVLLAVFTVVRNVPPGAWLAP